MKSKPQRTTSALAALCMLLSLFGTPVIAPQRALAAPAGSGPNWPAWRGEDMSGVSNEKNLPTEWSGSQNVLWKTPIPGRGLSSPIVWGNRIFVTTAIEGEVIPGAKAPVHIVTGAGGNKQEFKHPDSFGADRKHTMKVICLDGDSGKILWEQMAYEGPVYDDRHRKSSYASPTPATDGKYVFAYFGSEGLYAYDFKGRQLWKADLGKIGTVGMGTATSPILYKNLVIVQADSEEGESSFIAAFDKASGKEAWRASRKGIEVSWSTPVIARAGSRDELIAPGNQFIIAYDPQTGKELWRSKGLESNAIPTPLVGHGLVIVSAGYPSKRVLAIKLGGQDDVSKTQVAWSYDKGTAYVPSPILYGDYVYLTTDKGLITCLDAKTGELKYQGGRPPIPATFTGSLVAFEGKLLQVNDDGDAFLIQAGPEHKVLKQNSLGEAVYSTPAIAGGRIYIRGAQNLYAIGGK